MAYYGCRGTLGCLARRRRAKRATLVLLCLAVFTMPSCTGAGDRKSAPKDAIAPSQGISASPSTELASPSKPDYAGIWTIFGSASAAGRPWYKGQHIHVPWREIEPEDGRFDWSNLDREIDEAAGQGLFVMVQPLTGDQAPTWLYQRGVPRYDTEFKGRPRSFPFYPDPRYKRYFKRMESAVAEHLARYPAPARSRIIGVQGAVGTSGDPTPYKSDGAKPRGGANEAGEGTSFHISPQQWDAFQREMFSYIDGLYRSTSPPIHPLFNVNDSKAMADWAVANLPGIWVKTGRIGDRYQNNGETAPDHPTSFLAPYISQFQNGRAVRARSEMDSTDQGWFRAAPTWNMYWTQLWGLHNRQDIHNQLPEDVERPEYAPAFDFYSKYAGYKDPENSVGVWIALRDGLDAADTRRFPEARYGPAKRSNGARFMAIADAETGSGARQDDPSAAARTSESALNDVGWQIHRGNYEMWLTQRDPDRTSKGLWRQGPQWQMHGRFARRFDHANGKDAMSFDIDDRFFGGRPLAGKYAVTVRIVYLDAGRGSWALTYDSTSDPAKRAYTVTKTGTGQWKEKVVTLRDASLGDRLPHGSDLALVNTDDEDDTFHMIELTRNTGSRTRHAGD